MKADNVISLLALVIAIVMPLIMYRWFDQKTQELRVSPRLFLIESVHYGVDFHSYGMTITNQGLLPAAGVKILFRAEDSDILLPDQPEIRIEPPSPFTVNKSGKDIVVTLDRNIGDGQRVNVNLCLPPTKVYRTTDEATNDLLMNNRRITVWVYYERGEAPPTDWTGGVSVEPGRSRLFARTAPMPKKKRLFSQMASWFPKSVNLSPRTRNGDADEKRGRS